MEHRRARVWDVPTRVFHWLLVILIAFAWWTFKSDHMQWHRYTGYAVLALLAFRIFWGFFGHQTARFAQFLKGPGGVWRYLTHRAAPVLGHNPLGALSVMALLALVAVQAGSGLFSADDEGIEAGPFANSIGFERAQDVEHWHGIAFNVLLGFVALHVAAIAIYGMRGDNLIGPMLTGRKSVPVETPEPARARLLSHVAGFVLALLVFAGLLWLDRAANL